MWMTEMLRRTGEGLVWKWLARYLSRSEDQNQLLLTAQDPDLPDNRTVS